MLVPPKSPFHCHHMAIDKPTHGRLVLLSMKESSDHQEVPIAPPPIVELPQPLTETLGSYDIYSRLEDKRRMIPAVKRRLISEVKRHVALENAVDECHSRLFATHEIGETSKNQELHEFLRLIDEKTHKLEEMNVDSFVLDIFEGSEITTSQSQRGTFSKYFEKEISVLAELEDLPKEVEKETVKVVEKETWFYDYIH